MVDDNPSRRPKEIDITIGQILYCRGHFCDKLNEFVIVKNFGLEHIEVHSRTLPDVDPKIARGFCTPL